MTYHMKRFIAVIIAVMLKKDNKTKTCLWCY